MTYKLVLKDAFWQIFWRVISALAGFLVIKIVTPYLWPLRFWDYSTILKYFAIWSAFADFWLYVVALKRLWEIKNNWAKKSEIETIYWKYLTTRFLMIIVIYTLALIIAYFIPSYTDNQYLIRWIPLWMLFSASFMTAWILQIPLQLYWKMEQLSIALIIARIVQILILVLTVYIFFPWTSFDWSSSSVMVFMLILFSVVASWIAQSIYVLRKWNKFLKFNINFDLQFIKSNIIWNFKYWLSYYLSSFHTLVVLIVLSIVFPTIKNYEYVWIWALSLALIEILLIIPAALWNSLIHKVSWKPLEEKLINFWSLLKLIIWIWWIFLINFSVFSYELINIIWWEKYLSNWQIWSDFILPFLAFVLLLSFVKQVFNYIFVSTDNQNKLLWINFNWVLIWSIIWIPLIYYYNIIWWIITQILLEILFVLWAIYIAYKNNILPKIDKILLLKVIWIITIFLVLGLVFVKWTWINIWIQIMIWISINLLILLISFKPIKQIIKTL